MKTNKNEVAQAEVTAIGQRLATMQKRMAQIKQRQTVILTESDKLDEEETSLRAEHAALLRKFDSAAALP